MGCTTSSELEAGQVSEAAQKELEHRIQQLAGNKTGGQVQQAEIAPGESVNAADPSDVLLMIKRNLPSLSDQVVSAPSTMHGRRTGSTCTAPIKVTKLFFFCGPISRFQIVRMVFRILDEAGEHTHQMEHVKQHGTVPPEVLRASLSQVVAAIGVQAGFVLGCVCRLCGSFCRRFP